MADSSRLGPWVRRFLLEHLINERNLSRGTRQSYRDTVTLLIPFVARKARRSVDAMEVIHVSADLVKMFLLHLEESRGCAISARNQRYYERTRTHFRSNAAYEWKEPAASRTGVARCDRRLPLRRCLLPQRRPKLVASISKKRFAIAKADA